MNTRVNLMVAAVVAAVLASVSVLTAAQRSNAADDEAADVYGQLKAAVLDRFGPREKAKRRKAKTERLGFSENDMWIAAIARRRGLTVVSADSDFQRIAEAVDLTIETWVASVVDPSGQDGYGIRQS